MYVELTMLHMPAACKLLTVPAGTQTTQACAMKANEQKAQVGANKGQTRGKQGANKVQNNNRAEVTGKQKRTEGADTRHLMGR